jgi:hypothetical protein
MILSLLMAAAVLAGPPTAPKPKPAASEPVTYAPAKLANAKDNQLVCRNEVAPGSHLTVRICRTVADMRTRQLLDRQEIEHMQLDRSPGY